MAVVTTDRQMFLTTMSRVVKEVKADPELVSFTFQIINGQLRIAARYEDYTRGRVLADLGGEKP
jgi:hypothetical protein